MPDQTEVRAYEWGVGFGPGTFTFVHQGVVKYASEQSAREMTALLPDALLYRRPAGSLDWEEIGAATPAERETARRCLEDRLREVANRA